MRSSLQVLRPLLLAGLLWSAAAVEVAAARTHVVEAGETLSSIAAKYGVAVADLKSANNLSNANLVKRGQSLVIPDKPGAAWTGSHTVKAGETLSTIAEAHGVAASELARANSLADADLIKRGQTLKVPARSPAPAPPPAASDPPAPAADPGGASGSSTGNATTAHVVKRGETLSTIAARHGVTVRDLALANNMRDVDRLLRGQKLVIPQGAPAFIEHRVAKGESLAIIASRYKVATADIRAANTLDDPNHIVPGQVLRIPASDTAIAANGASAAPEPAPARPPADLRRRVPASVQAAIDSAKVERGRWKQIIIHHSATEVGSVRGMDRFHREQRRMENGLAYHFVIGNGKGMTDGSVFVGRRWNEQLDGGHMASADLNQVALGICLVGDFQKKPPSRRQMASLEALVRSLMKRTGLPPDAVTTHRLAHPKHTLCPGKHFPTEEFRAALRTS